MTLELYNASSGQRKAIKQKTLITSVSGSLVHGSSIIDPVIELVELSSIPATANYMYIPEFSRYYWITDIRAGIPNGMYTIAGHVDVLASHWTQLSNNKAVLARCETEKYISPMLVDDKLPASVQKAPRVITFGKSFSHKEAGTCCVLTLAGCKIT